MQVLQKAALVKGQMESVGRYLVPVRHHNVEESIGRFGVSQIDHPALQSETKYK